jgi:hypothetical protein
MKYVTLLVVFLGSQHLLAMDAIRTVDDKKITLTLEQGALEVPELLVRELITCRNLLDDLKTTSFLLPEVSLEVMKVIITQLERLKAADLAGIKDDYRKLPADNLLRVLWALDYLDHPHLLSTAFEIALEAKAEDINPETIASLHTHLRSPLIKKQVAALAGVTYEKRQEIATSSHDDDEDTYPGISDTRVCKVQRHTKLDIGTAVRSVFVTPDNKIVSGSIDNIVRVWDMQGNQLAVCYGHENVVSSVFVTPENKIVSGSWDKTVRVWDMKILCLLERINSLTQDQSQKVWQELKSYHAGKDGKTAEECLQTIEALIQENV